MNPVAQVGSGTTTPQLKSHLCTLYWQQQRLAGPNQQAETGTSPTPT